MASVHQVRTQCNVEGSRNIVALKRAQTASQRGYEEQGFTNVDDAGEAACRRVRTFESRESRRSQHNTVARGPRSGSGACRTTDSDVSSSSFNHNHHDANLLSLSNSNIVGVRPSIVCEMLTLLDVPASWKMRQSANLFFSSILED